MKLPLIWRKLFQTTKIIKMKNSALIYTIIISVFASCSNQEAAPAKSTATKDTTQLSNDVQLTAAQLTNANIETGFAEKRAMHKTLKVTGVLDVPPKNMVSVSMPLGGYLKKTELLPGAHVHKGEVLATMEDQQYVQLQQDYLTAKSKLVYNEAEYKRQQQLNETKAASDKVYQQARSEYEGQEILVKALGEKLLLIGVNPERLTINNISKSINLYAPITGYVTKINVNIGKYVTPTDVLFELISPEEMHLSLTVFENDAANIVTGQKVVCYSNIHPETKYEATVHLVNPSIGKERSTEVHCDLGKYGKELMPGMYMNAIIDLNSAITNALPEDAVVKWNNEYYVFCEQSTGKYTMQKVSVGATDEGYVEITSTLPVSKIVLKNAYALLMKLKNGGEE
jgi:cobalt-zinc-cadmium efflux system membrane fusion protein